MTILLYRCSLLMILYSVIRGMDQGWFCNTTYDDLVIQRYDDLVIPRRPMTILLHPVMMILLYCSIWAVCDHHATAV